MKTRNILPAAIVAAGFLTSTPSALAGPPPFRQNQGTRLAAPSDKQEPFHLAGARSLISKPRNVVARDEKAFAALWAEHAKKLDGTVPPMPRVDFRKYDVVAVFLGSEPTGGHAAEIGDIKRDGKKAVIKVTHWKPGPGMMVIQSFTTPFAMKAVPKLPPTVTFDVTTAERK
jgi:hypothetical protein